MTRDWGDDWNQCEQIIDEHSEAAWRSRAKGLFARWLLRAARAGTVPLQVPFKCGHRTHGPSDEETHYHHPACRNNPRKREEEKKVVARRTSSRFCASKIARAVQVSTPAPAVPCPAVPCSHSILTSLTILLLFLRAG